MTETHAKLAHRLFDGVRHGFEPSDQELFSKAPEWIQELYREAMSSSPVCVGPSRALSLKGRSPRK